MPMTTPTCERCQLPLTPATSRIRGSACWECLKCKQHWESLPKPPLGSVPDRIKRNLSTPKSRQWWESAEKIAKQVESWPPQMRAGINIPQMQANPTNVCEHGDHPAPEGKRFCSKACFECERDSEDGCDGICMPYGHDWQPRVGGLARYQTVETKHNGKLVQVVEILSEHSIVICVSPNPEDYWVVDVCRLYQPTLTGYGLRRKDGTWVRENWELNDLPICGETGRITTQRTDCQGPGWTSEPVPAHDDPTPEEFARANPGRKLNWLEILHVRARLDEKRKGWYAEWRERKREVSRRMLAAEKISKEDP